MAAVLSRMSQWTRLPPGQLLAELSRVFPPWVALVLAILIGWQVARAIWLLFPAPGPAELPPVTAAPRAATAEADTGVSIDRIVDAHLFGEARDSGGEEAVALVEQDDAPDTQLSLELRGTIAASDEQRALAIIAERGGDERVYFLGDAIPGGATLHAVHMDRVLLRRAGRLEALRLPRSDETRAAGGAARVPAPPTRRPSPRAASVREVVQRNPTALTQVIRPQPVFKDGRQAGYRVYPGREREIFAELGLRPGDLVTQINGMALDDPSRGMEIFRGLADATSVTVTLDRNGQIEMLTLDTAALQQGLGNANNTPSE